MRNIIGFGGGLAVLVLLVVVGGYCVEDKSDTSRGDRIDSKVETTTTKVINTQAERTPEPSPRATVDLPPKGFVLADVLGKTKREVDLALGHGNQLEDGPWNYDFGKVSVVVVFEAGRAAFVSVTAPDFHNTNADRAAVLAWMNASPDADFDHMHNFNFELGIWSPGAQDRQLARREVAKTVTERLRESGGFGYGTVAANYTRLEVSLRDEDSCTRATLVELSRKYNLKSAGFESLECMTMSRASPVLQLR